MNYFDINKLVEKEILPEINCYIQDYLEDKFGYIESSEDLEDLEYAEVDDDLVEAVKNDIYELIDDVSNEYDLSSVDDKEINNEILYQIIDSSFNDWKEMLLEKYRDEFDKIDYFDEYYSNEEF